MVPWLSCMTCSLIISFHLDMDRRHGHLLGGKVCVDAGRWTCQLHQLGSRRAQPQHRHWQWRLCHPGREQELALERHCVHHSRLLRLRNEVRRLCFLLHEMSGQVQFWEQTNKTSFKKGCQQGFNGFYLRSAQQSVPQLTEAEWERLTTMAFKTERGEGQCLGRKRNMVTVLHCRLLLLARHIM